MLIPRALVPGDLVGIAAPASPFDHQELNRGLEILRSWGVTPIHDAGLFARTGYLAGPDSRRLAELRDLLGNADLGAVLCARGGYGTMRLLRHLRTDDFPEPRKLVVGFSDITALQAYLTDTLGVATIHGPLVTTLGRLHERWLEPFRRLLFEPAPLGTLLLDAADPIRGGRASGIVKGGNLSVLTRLLGTPFMPDLRGAVLFFEDVGERPYRLDRMLTHLRLAGALDGVAAVLVGDLAGCVEAKAGPGDPDAAAVVRESLAELPVPVLAGFPSGHGDRLHPLPLGLRISVDADRGEVHFEEGLAPR